MTEARHRIEPDWDVYTEFIKKINVALDLDAKRSSHPVQLHAESPGEIGQVSTLSKTGFRSVSDNGLTTYPLGI
jgi:aminopeptidase N